MVNPAFVARDGMQLEEEGCLSAARLQRDGRPSARARSCKGLDRHGNEQTIEGTDLLARAFQHEMDHLDGAGLRRSAARHQARHDRPEDPEAEARRQMVTPAAAHRCIFGTPAFAVPSLDALHRLGATPSSRSSRSRIGRRAAGTLVATPTKAVATADGHPGAGSRRSSATKRSSSDVARSNAGPRRRRGVRQDPAGCAAADPAARDDQRARARCCRDSAARRRFIAR